VHDADPLETAEWRDAFLALVQAHGPARGRFLLVRLLGALLQDSRGPVVAATDYVRAVPESIRAHVPAERRYRTLGTDGFACSDTRAALRRHFDVDADAIVATALGPLTQA
jgi:pyruvate dehydrogenase complex dehydrogenase (E1) component